MLNQRFYFRFLSFVLIITAFLPIVTENLPIIIGSFRFFWAPLWLISLVIFRFKILINKVIIRFLVYGMSLAILIPSVWFNMDDWLVKYILEEFYWMITIVSVITYYASTKDYQSLVLILKWTLVFIFITSIISIIASVINPMYARLLTSASSGFNNTSEGSFFTKLGAGTYSFGQALICLFPILIYYYKQDKKLKYSKFILLIYIILLYITVIRMQFFANIILASMVIIVSLLGSKRIRLSIFIVSLFIITAFIIPKELYVNILIRTSKYFNVNSENFYKITDMAQFISTGNLEAGSTGNRLSRYPMLFEAFIRMPIIGNAGSLNPKEISDGYHLHWMGKLGATGILGFILFLSPHIYFLKTWFKKFSEEYAFFAGISFLAFFILGMMKTIAGRDIWFMYFFIVPGMYFWPLVNNEKVQKKL